MEADCRVVIKTLLRGSVKREKLDKAGIFSHAGCLLTGIVRQKANFRRLVANKTEIISSYLINLTENYMRDLSVTTDLEIILRHYGGKKAFRAE